MSVDPTTLVRDTSDAKWSTLFRGDGIYLKSSFFQEHAADARLYIFQDKAVVCPRYGPLRVHTLPSAAAAAAAEGKAVGPVEVSGRPLMEVPMVGSSCMEASRGRVWFEVFEEGCACRKCDFSGALMMLDLAGAGLYPSSTGGDGGRGGHDDPFPLTKVLSRLPYKSTSLHLREDKLILMPAYHFYNCTCRHPHPEAPPRASHTQVDVHTGFQSQLTALPPYLSRLDDGTYDVLSPEGLYQVFSGGATGEAILSVDLPATDTAISGVALTAPTTALLLHGGRERPFRTATVYEGGRKVQEGGEVVRHDRCAVHGSSHVVVETTEPRRRVFYGPTGSFEVHPTAIWTHCLSRQLACFSSTVSGAEGDTTILQVVDLSAGGRLHCWTRQPPASCRDILHLAGFPEPKEGASPGRRPIVFNLAPNTAAPPPRRKRGRRGRKRRARARR